MVNRYLPRRALPTLLAAFLILAGCATTDRDQWDAERYYQEAREALDDERYQTAVQYYQELETNFPYGAHAEQGQLDLAYAYYRQSEPDSAIATAERFIQMHPRHPHVDYAYYVRGLSGSQKNRNALNDLFGQDPAKRDPSALRKTFDYYAELVRKHPESRYAEDAAQRMVHLRNSLAAYEVHVARFYLERDAHVAAANRASRVLEDFDQTPAVVDALTLMVEAYTALGQDELAASAEELLAHNAPGHDGRTR
ncbi:MAG: outer membrane protein assembly factor BamD [Pseudomonadota bacterium]